MPTADDLLFAEHAVKAGFVTRDEVEASLTVQQRMEEMGVRDTLRNVMVNRGVLREGDAALVARSAGISPGRDPIPGFLLEARLGIGAMGSVYKAWQKGMQRHVAVKILRRDLTNDPRQVDRLRREAALVGKLDHPNIVRGLDSGESNGLVWFAMEYVDGETLRDRIRRDGRVPVDEALAVTRQIAEALEHAHAQGIVHRDIKPGNILLTKQGLPRLSDYGLAKGQTDDALTQVDATLGTPQYVAPEQARDPRDADIRSDVYSLGATLYTMLSGRPPFEGETLAQTLTKVLYERPKSIRDLVPDLPDPVVYLVERMMAKDRRHRYATPSALLHDLRALEEGHLRVPLGFTGDIAVFEEKRRSRLLWVGGAAVVVVAVALASVALWLERESQSRRNATVAQRQLEDVRDRAGPEASWDAATVADAIRSLDALRAEFPLTAAAQQAGDDLRRWHAQQRELTGVRDLAQRAAAADVDWARMVEELEAAQKRLAAAPDAGVARRLAATALAGLRERRETASAREVATLRDETRAATLADAEAAWRALGASIRSRYLRDERAPAADEADAVAARFDQARTRLDDAFAAWDRNGPRHLAASSLREAAGALAAVDERLTADAELRTLLAELPPAGRWTKVADERRDAAARRLEETARRALETLRADVDRLLARRAFDDADARLRQFDLQRLDDQADAVADLRNRLGSERRAEEQRGKDETGRAATRFLDAYGRMDADTAAKALDEFEATLRAAPVADPGGAEFLAGARRLLELTEEVVWRRFRENLPAYAAGGGALSDRRGIRYAAIQNVRVGRTDLAFTYGNAATPWQGAITDIAIDDVLAVARLAPDRPEGALVAAALRVTQYRMPQAPQDPRRGLVALRDANALLQAARAVQGAGGLVDRLEELRQRRAAETQEVVDADETAARRRHAGAKEELEAGRPDLAIDGLRALLEDPRLRQTDYVQRFRDEVRRDLDAAQRARVTGSYAARFPGARLTESPDGTAELLFDFESPAFVERAETRTAYGLDARRVEILSRYHVVADRPSRADRADAPPAGRLEHVLSWLPADEQGEPRDAPLRVDAPFRPGKRVEVSCVVRAERPFFFAISAYGVTAGVLSASESPFGGRGAAIWLAGDLERPDRAFDRQFEERARSGRWTPEMLRKDGETTWFQFEPGRLHRVRFVKDENRAQLWVDGRLRVASDARFRADQAGQLADRVVLLTYGALDVDDLRITGTLDPEWLSRRR